MENKSRKSNKRSRKNNFWKKYNFEIFISALIGIGIFLLVENFDIKRSIINFYLFVYNFFIKVILKLYSFILNILSDIENSDLIGLSLISLAVLLILLRWRQRLINDYSTYEVCRYCDSRIHRIKRRKRIKVFAYIFKLKIKRYQCTECNQVGYIIKSL